MKPCLGLLLLVLAPLLLFAQATLPDSFTALQTQLATQPDSIQMERLRDFVQARIDHGVFPEAVAANQFMVAMAERTGNRLFLGQAYVSAGDIAKSEGNPSQAIIQFQRAVLLYRQLGEWHRQASTLGRIGGTYVDIQNLPLAEEYYNQALTVAQKHDLKRDIAYAYGDLATVYDLRKQHSKALWFNAQSISISKSIGADYSVAMFNQGIYFKNAGRYRESVSAYQQALQWAKAHQDTYMEEYIYLNLPNTLLLLNRPDEAEHYTQLALQSVRSFPNQERHLQEIYETLTTIYEKRGQYQQALDYHKQWVVHRDSVFNAEKSRQLVEAETRFQTREKQQQIQRLDENNLRQKQQLQWLIGGVSLLVLLLGIMAWQYRALRRANERVNQTLNELQRTQDQLIQKEKMASLGELTAGIAHEIQNPLNFVNNFAQLSVDLARELQEEFDKVSIPAADKAYLGDIVQDLASNQSKINQHGQRASSIVKGMLEHSRAGSGEPQLTNLNALANEYLRMAYSGFQAKDKQGLTSDNPADRDPFNSQLITDFEADLAPIELVPQDMGRVLLNLYNNAFYAVRERQKQAGDDYHPTIRVSTKRLKNKIEIRVQDNGTGIPDSIRAKIFQPFFTTKPTGEGTGLGLSLSYDIVTKGHGGTLAVESVAGEGTEFTITLLI
ncbi:histidine kinase [Fibrisoma limi BUZ 3]|uniref:histidine kinase n=1 Tax=Fibrisoma limi BUZ 3 TaxID=1185876 RepID=I2GK47_9BACT|nr:ATP-binding protein [Fibrisoma limi]CCH54272.1 histidine kinase [Fibrisoma limi BUZ 3]